MQLPNELIEDLKEGCTVFGFWEAIKLREFGEKHPDLITFVPTHELQKSGGVVEMNGKRAYFGAVLTKKGYEHFFTKIK